MSQEEERLEAIVHGRVQGVNFRHYTQMRARELRLKGYVRNRWDGTVEVVAEGPADALAELMKFLHEGPPYALVVNVDAQWRVAAGEFDQFGVRF